MNGVSRRPIHGVPERPMNGVLRCPMHGSLGGGMYGVLFPCALVGGWGGLLLRLQRCV